MHTRWASDSGRPNGVTGSPKVSMLEGRGDAEWNCSLTVGNADAQGYCRVSHIWA